MKYIVSIVFVFTFFFTHAQELIFDLPVVGDTIDYNEKVNFVLFDDVLNKDFIFAVISQQDKDTLLVEYLKTGRIERKVGLQYIVKMVNTINKLNAYYSTIETEKNTQTSSRNEFESSLSVSATEQRRLDSLLNTDPMMYKEIKRNQKKTAKKKKWYDRDPGKIETDPNSPAFKEERMRTNVLAPR